ncbi:MAG: DUF2971 domain-containing protein [Saprospiraceae bacterium]
MPWSVINSLDKAPMPDKVYKYRFWSKSEHKTILTNQELFFAPPLILNKLDPNDCNVPVRYDLLTPREIYERYLRHSKRMHPHWKIRQHKDYAIRWRKKAPFKNEEFKKKTEEEFYQVYSSRFGVLSLTVNPTSFHMWEDYADGHKGICVGYNTRVLYQDRVKFGGGGMVDYDDELPIIHPNEEYLEKYRKITFSKLKKYEPEEEFRSHKMYENPVEDFGPERKAIVPVEAFIEVIIGAKIPEDDKAEILTIMQTQFPDVPIRQARITDQNTIEIEDLA